MWSDDRTRPAVRLAYAAMYAAGALMLSFLEALLPPLPIPGARLGLANLALLLCFCHMGPGWGTAVSLVRWLLTGLLFGSGTSMLFAFAGMCGTLASLWLLRTLPPGKRLSFLGLSVLAAVSHNLGQLLCAGLLYGWGLGLLAMYGGWLVLLGAGCGLLTGTAANLLVGRLQIYFLHL